MLPPRSGKRTNPRPTAAAFAAVSTATKQFARDHAIVRLGARSAKADFPEQPPFMCSYRAAAAKTSAGEAVFIRDTPQSLHSKMIWSSRGQSGLATARVGCSVFHTSGSSAAGRRSFLQHSAEPLIIETRMGFGNWSPAAPFAQDRGAPAAECGGTRGYRPLQSSKCWNTYRMVAGRGVAGQRHKRTPAAFPG